MPFLQQTPPSPQTMALQRAAGALCSVEDISPSSAQLKQRSRERLDALG